MSMSITKNFIRLFNKLKENPRSDLSSIAKGYVGS